jgi:hypothetical protein
MVVYFITNVAYICTIDKENELIAMLKDRGDNVEEYQRKVFNEPICVDTDYTGIPNLYGLVFSKV